MVSGHDVDLVDEERMDEFIVKFLGPQDSLYAGVSKYFTNDNQGVSNQTQIFVNSCFLCYCREFGGYG